VPFLGHLAVSLPGGVDNGVPFDQVQPLESLP
jgi:hypothetical protein